MRMLRFVLAVFAATLFFIAPAAYAGGDNDILYQVSSISALEGGSYDGLEYVSDLMQHGGFGIGTFDMLDGDMVVLDGTFYHVKSDGEVKEADNNSMTPFADVTFFETDLAWKLGEPSDLGVLEAFLDEMLPDDGLIYAVKVTGWFIYVRTRIENTRMNPYQSVDGAVEEQGDFMQNSMNGTLVGFRMPRYMAGGLNMPGYHFHFINNNRGFGGHVIDCGIMTAEVQADATDQFFVALPERGWSMPNDSAIESLEAEENAE